MKKLNLGWGFTMSNIEIMHLDHERIAAYVEYQVAQGRDRVSVLKEIASTRSDVILLSVREDKTTFLQKIEAALKSS